ncbi:MAG TPA: AMP-binding protein [Steroidobacteraceae bacterium]|nr:AMP-binding protein [Steroidobacteraceae bacterium]
MSPPGPYDWIASVARSDPARPCLSDGGDWRLSYADVDRAAGLHGAALMQLGVRPGDRVALHVDKSLDVVLVYLACLRIGAVIVPLNTAYTMGELEYFLNDSEPSVLLARPEGAAALALAARAAGARLETLGTSGDGTYARRVAAETTQVPAANVSPAALAALLYTSGTTGRSKGAMITRANLLANAHALVGAWHMSAQDTLVHVLPLFHVHGLFLSLNVLLAAGGSVRLLQRFDPTQTIVQLASASAFMGVPTHYTRLLASAALSPEAVAGVRLFVSGSAPLLAQTHREFEARTGKAILERYGMTETLVNTTNPYVGPRKPGSVGLPLPGVEVRITDTVRAENGSDVGMIEIRGPNVCAGYWRAPEKTAADRTEDGFFRTGDLGTLDGDGYLSIVGRTKDLVISGGLNVYPKEVELELDALPGIVESAVFGVPHPDLGEAVTAAIALRPGITLDETALIGALRARLAAYKVPKRILVVGELPRNSMGKVQKNRLREDHRDLYRR